MKRRAILFILLVALTQGLAFAQQSTYNCCAQHIGPKRPYYNKRNLGDYGAKQKEAALNRGARNIIKALAENMTARQEYVDELKAEGYASPGVFSYDPYLQPVRPAPSPSATP